MKHRRGQAVRRALEQLMVDSRYARLNDSGRIRAIERLLPRVRQRVTTNLRGEYPACQVSSRLRTTRPPMINCAFCKSRVLSRLWYNAGSTQFHDDARH